MNDLPEQPPPPYVAFAEAGPESPSAYYGEQCQYTSHWTFEDKVDLSKPAVAKG